MPVCPGCTPQGSQATASTDECRVTSCLLHKHTDRGPVSTRRGVRSALTLHSPAQNWLRKTGRLRPDLHPNTLIRRKSPPPSPQKLPARLESNFQPPQLPRSQYAPPSHPRSRRNLPGWSEVQTQPGDQRFKTIRLSFKAAGETKTRLNPELRGWRRASGFTRPQLLITTLDSNSRGCQSQAKTARDFNLLRKKVEFLRHSAAEKSLHGNSSTR